MMSIVICLANNKFKLTFHSVLTSLLTVSKKTIPPLLCIIFPERLKGDEGMSCWRFELKYSPFNGLSDRLLNTLDIESNPYQANYNTRHLTRFHFSNNLHPLQLSQECQLSEMLR